MYTAFKKNWKVDNEHQNEIESMDEEVDTVVQALASIGNAYNVTSNDVNAILNDRGLLQEYLSHNPCSSALAHLLRLSQIKPIAFRTIVEHLGSERFSEEQMLSKIVLNNVISSPPISCEAVTRFLLLESPCLKAHFNSLNEKEFETFLKNFMNRLLWKDPSQNIVFYRFLEQSPLNQSLLNELLFEACELENHELAKLLIERGAEATEEHLLWAVSMQDINMVKMFLRRNTYESLSLSIVTEALNIRNLTLIEYLFIEAGHRDSLQRHWNEYLTNLCSAMDLPYNYSNAYYLEIIGNLANLMFALQIPLKPEEHNVIDNIHIHLQEEQLIGMFSRLIGFNRDLILSNTTEEPVAFSSIEGARGNTECPITFDPIEGSFKVCRKCKYSFDKEALNHWLELNRTCPHCRSPASYFVECIPE